MPATKTIKSIHKGTTKPYLDSERRAAQSARDVLLGYMPVVIRDHFDATCTEWVQTTKVDAPLMAFFERLHAEEVRSNVRILDDIAVGIPTKPFLGQSLSDLSPPSSPPTFTIENTKKADMLEGPLPVIPVPIVGGTPAWLPAGMMNVPFDARTERVDFVELGKGFEVERLKERFEAWAPPTANWA